MDMTSAEAEQKSIGRLNLVLLFSAAAVCVLFLWVASQPIHIGSRVMAAFAFSFTCNSIFALLHEAVHGNLHKDRRINEIAGSFAAAFFPTALSLQRAFHLTHHRNNRSELERFDYFENNQNRVLKVAQWYSILTGLYWTALPIFALVYSATAGFVTWQRLLHKESRLGRQTSSLPYLEAVREVSAGRVRLEVLATIFVQATIVYFADVTLVGWVLCYGFFAINWSSLQYADHAFSRLDRVEGAWNLKVHPLVRSLFLNYHYHLVHHRYPTLSWRQLPARHNADDPEQSFRQILLCMWTGPRPLPDGAETDSCLTGQISFDLLVNLTIGFIFGIFFYLLYGSASSISANGPFAFDLDLPMEEMLPFLPWTAIIYLSALGMHFLSIILMKTPERFLPLVITGAIEVLIAWWIYVCFPSPGPVVPPLAQEFGGAFFRIADTINLNGNNFPSLHVALTTTVAIALGRELGGHVRWVFYVWAFAVALSCVVTKQHNIADVFGGAVLAWLAMRVIHPRIVNELRDGLKHLGLAHTERV